MVYFLGGKKETIQQVHQKCAKKREGPIRSQKNNETEWTEKWVMGLMAIGYQ
jgi:hypothetical protein